MKNCLPIPCAFLEVFLVQNLDFFFKGILKVIHGIQSGLWKCPLKYFEGVSNTLTTVPHVIDCVSCFTYVNVEG